MRLRKILVVLCAVYAVLTIAVLVVLFPYLTGAVQILFPIWVWRWIGVYFLTQFLLAISGVSMWSSNEIQE